MKIVLVSLAATFGCAYAAMADDTAFRKQVAPLFAQHCVKCHHGDHPKGGLSLSNRAAFLQGGESGSAVTAGDADASLLIDYVTGDEPAMPKNAPPLSANEVAILRDWINAGAMWPEDLIVEDSNRPTRDWWSFKPILQPEPPAISLPELQAKTRNPIDAFVFASLLEKQLHPSDEADRRTLIRRLSFDLLGLPPTPEEVSAFINDNDPQAYERLVDRMLASPHYGERWARHWLDVAHYADTHGFERDQRRDNAWRYRDYVIRALNDDKPYHDFLREQIAGDVLRPDDTEAIIATGFLAAGPWDLVGQVETRSDVLRRAARADDLDDMVAQVMTAACGMTVNCARCHDHKLDPILQREYYALWAVFSGVKRGDRPADPPQAHKLEELKQQLTAQKREFAAALARLGGTHLDLSDLVGGGNGLGTGKRGQGIDPLTGKPQAELRGFVENVVPNRFVRSSLPGIDGVVVPDASPEGTPVSSTDLVVHDVADTSSQTWDAIRHGPLNSQFTTRLGSVDYGGEDHTLLSIHANAAITFDLNPLRTTISSQDLRFTATAGYFGQTPRDGASYVVYLDGERAAEGVARGHDDGPQSIDVPIPPSARFLTLLVSDNGNGISHDQVCFVDPWLQPTRTPAIESREQERAKLAAQLAEVDRKLASIPQPDQVFAIQTEAPAPVRMLRRGNPEDPLEEVAPGTIECAGLPTALGDNATPEAERRLALANWITHADNPLTARVAVNRVWHYHFGTGLVDTPSDFGRGGGLPSHPELLDWLATEFRTTGWSLKRLHRLICTSATYRQQSISREDAVSVDANNRLLWRMHPRRLDAECVRDAILAVSGTLNNTMFGPGYRDFDYQEEYAPVYRYVTPDRSELWRRSIYRFIVRTTPNTLLTTLDCPNPANLTPVRNVTTTALQSLALLNNDFVLRQSEHFAARLEREGAADIDVQVRRAFALAFVRSPSDPEVRAASDFVRQHGLKLFCRTLFNTNEFIHVD